MSYTKTQGKTLDLKEERRSDGSELVPAEVQASNRQTKAQLADSIGYTVDDEGLVNSYAVVPDISISTYPSPRQQRRYIFLGIGAISLVSMLLLVAFTVS